MGASCPKAGAQCPGVEDSIVPGVENSIVGRCPKAKAHRPDCGHASKTARACRRPATACIPPGSRTACTRRTPLRTHAHARTYTRTHSYAAHARAHGGCRHNRGSMASGEARERHVWQRGGHKAQRSWSRVGACARLLTPCDSLHPAHSPTRTQRGMHMQAKPIAGPRPAASHKPPSCPAPACATRSAAWPAPRPDPPLHLMSFVEGP